MDDLREAFSERMWFGTLLILGYIVIVVIVLFAPIPPDRLAVAKDALLVLGPIAGAVANAVFRSDKVDKTNAASISSLATTVASQAATKEP